MQDDDEVLSGSVTKRLEGIGWIYGGNLNIAGRARKAGGTPKLPRSVILAKREDPRTSNRAAVAVQITLKANKIG